MFYLLFFKPVLNIDSLIGLSTKRIINFPPFGFSYLSWEKTSITCLYAIFALLRRHHPHGIPAGVIDAFSSAKVACPDDPASTDRLFQKKSLMAAFLFWRCRLPSVIYTAKSGIPCLFPRNSLPWSSAWVTLSPAQKKSIPDRLCR